MLIFNAQMHIRLHGP